MFHPFRLQRSAPTCVVSTERCAILLVLLASAFVTIACTADHDAEAAPSCGTESRCGGNPMGTWAIDSECLTIDSPFQQPECQNAIQNVSVTVHGSVTYDASAGAGGLGTQQSEVDSQFALSEHYSDACLKAIGFDGASADACHGLELLWAGTVAVSCQPITGACACDFADHQHSTDSQGFRLDGPQIVFDDSSRVDYCQSGDHLVETTATDSSRVIVSLHRTSP